MLLLVTLWALASVCGARPPAAPGRFRVPQTGPQARTAGRVAARSDPTTAAPDPPTTAGSREAAFVKQTIARTPSYLAEFSIPGAAVAVIDAQQRINERTSP